MHPAPRALARAVDAALEATVVLSFGRTGHQVRRVLDGWTDADGAGRRVLVTGANSGIGFALSRRLLVQGATVVAVTRDEAKGADTRRRLTDALGADVDGRIVTDRADLEDLASVRALAERVVAGGGVDVVVHNAGAMFADHERTVDGFERTYQVHVLAPFVLTALLLPSLATRRDARVITVTSGGMYASRLDVASLGAERGHTAAGSYASAKRAQVVANREWARRFGGHGVAFHAMHPGWALTPGVERSLPGFARLTGPILREPDEGADTIVHLALADAATLPSGRLWHDRRVRLEHRVPWTRSETGESGELWARLCRDGGMVPTVDVPGAAAS